MSFLSFLRDHLLAIVLYVTAAVTSGYFMSGLSLSGDAQAYVQIIFASAFVVPLFVDFFRQYAWHKKVRAFLLELDDKYRLAAILEEQDFGEAQFLTEVLDEVSVSMNEHVAAAERSRREYREYLERWIHEIKTPIASARLTAQNNPSSASRAIEADLARIEGYVMQALYYARSSAVEKDYIIESTTLEAIVDAALRRNAPSLIRAHFRITKKNLQVPVETDPKWIGFVLDQMIQNSVKYEKGDEGALTFSSEVTENACTLVLEDEGIGVLDEDMSRIFEKGFTGRTGRTQAASTGMGLYICRQLLSKMGLSVRAEHATAGGLRLCIRFPRGSMHAFASPGAAVQ